MAPPTGQLQFPLGVPRDLNESRERLARVPGRVGRIANAQDAVVRVWHVRGLEVQDQDERECGIALDIHRGIG